MKHRSQSLVAESSNVPISQLLQLSQLSPFPELKRAGTRRCKNGAAVKSEKTLQSNSSFQHFGKLGLGTRN